jgi:hypothetical protein
MGFGAGAFGHLSVGTHKALNAFIPTDGRTGWVNTRDLERARCLPFDACRMIFGLYNESVVMRCIHCRGRMKRRKAPSHIDRDGCHVTIDNVPA